MQLTTQKGITAGLEADQAAKLTHIDSLKEETTALGVALKAQQELTQTTKSHLEAEQADQSHHDSVIKGQTWSAC